MPPSLAAKSKIPPEPKPPKPPKQPKPAPKPNQRPAQPEPPQQPPQPPLPNPQPGVSVNLSRAPASSVPATPCHSNRLNRLEKEGDDELHDLL
eukprot:5221917-Pleurochrysis_carterae.AAC.1